MTFRIPLVADRKYSIDKNGNIYLNDNILCPIKKDSRYFIRINNSLVDIEYIYRQTFYGIEEWIEDFLNDKISIYYSNSDTFTIHNTVFKRMYGEIKYYISKSGTIISFSRKKNKKGILLKRQISENGYFIIKIHSKILKIHREVYKAYNGPIPSNFVIDHIDGNKGNPFLDNLELVTYAENTRRSLSMGLQVGKRWDIVDIENVCRMLENKATLDEICTEFHFKKLQSENEAQFRRVVIMLLHTLISNKLFYDITKKYNISSYNTYINKKDRKLSEDDVRYIKSNSSKMKQIDLAKKFNVSKSTIQGIIYGRKWKYIQ